MPVDLLFDRAVCSDLPACATASACCLRSAVMFGTPLTFPGLLNFGCLPGRDFVEPEPSKLLPDFLLICFSSLAFVKVHGQDDGREHPRQSLSARTPLALPTRALSGLAAEHLRRLRLPWRPSQPASGRVPAQESSEASPSWASPSL